MWNKHIGAEFWIGFSTKSRVLISFLNLRPSNFPTTIFWKGFPFPNAWLLHPCSCIISFQVFCCVQLVYMALFYSYNSAVHLKPYVVISQTFLYLLRITLVICVLFCFQIQILWYFSSISIKKLIRFFYVGYFESVKCFWYQLFFLPYQTAVLYKT